MAASLRLLLKIPRFERLTIYDTKYSISQGTRRLSTAVQKYDLIVIGGGSGGLACAKEAGVLGAKTAVLDYVDPSVRGTRWGLGGTCVNVGCIPKKLMHHAALLGHYIEDSAAFGWSIKEKPTHDWNKMVQQVQSYIKSLNWGHRVQLAEKNVQYFNAKGSLIDPRTLKAVDRKGKEMILQADNIVLAVGGRPNMMPEVPGVDQFAITSDDIFSLQRPPGKTLVIGGSYVALECAGFLRGLGYDVTVMLRSIPLRGFDQQMANLIVDHMKSIGVRFLHQYNIASLQRLDNQRLVASFMNDQRAEVKEEFDTVLLAAGRTASTRSLNLSKVGVDLTENGKVVGGHGGERERSSVENIYAIGDVLQGGIELTPVAIKAGKRLAQRLVNNTGEQMDYDYVPTTVFTPLEYGCVGLSEESAMKKYGADKIEVYHAFYKPLEWAAVGKKADQCYIKMVCLRPQDDRVLGLHFLGPNAGEVTQGFATAVKLGALYSNIEETLGIHPTCAEEIVKMSITKRSGLDPHVTGC